MRYMLQLDTTYRENYVEKEVPRNNVRPKGEKIAEQTKVSSAIPSLCYFTHQDF